MFIKCIDMGGDHGEHQAVAICVTTKVVSLRLLGYSLDSILFRNNSAYVNHSASSKYVTYCVLSRPISATKSTSLIAFDSL